MQHVVQMKDITKCLVLRVRLSRVAGIRMRVAMWMIGIAARLMSLPAEVEIVDRASDDSPEA